MRILSRQDQVEHIQAIFDDVLVRQRASPELIVVVARWAADVGLLIVGLEAGTGSLEERYLALTRDAGRPPRSPG